MARLIELKGSGDFTAGPTGTDGKGLAIIFDAADQSEAWNLAAAYFPPLVGNVPRGSIGVKEEAEGIYFIDVEYRNQVPSQTTNPSAGQPPDTARPPATPSGGSGGPANTDPITRDMTFSTGGATKRIYKSISTRHKLAKAGDTAPDFGGLIGVGKDGKVEGCEVVAPMADFSITKRFVVITFGWFRNMLDLVACTNADTWFGMQAGEALFKGADGNYKDGDKTPWTVTGKFGYARNYSRGDSAAIDAMLTVGEIEIPDMRGWEHLWVSYGPAVEEAVTVNGVAIKVPIEYPRWAYVEVVYGEGNLANLGLDILTIVDRLRAIRHAEPNEDLAELLGVEAAAIGWGPNGITIAGETISFQDARAALLPDPPDEGRPANRIRIEDL